MSTNPDMAEISQMDVESDTEEEKLKDVEEKEPIFLCKEPSCDSKRSGQFRRKYEFGKHLEKKHGVLLCPLLEKEQLLRLAPFTSNLIDIPDSGYYKIPEGQSGAEMKKQIANTADKGKAPAKKKKGEPSVGQSPDRKVSKIEFKSAANCRMISTRPFRGSDRQQQYGEGSGTKNGGSLDKSPNPVAKAVPRKVTTLSLSDAFAESLLSPQLATPMSDYPTYDESLCRKLPRAAIRITALKDPSKFSFPVEDPSVWRIPRDDPDGIDDWYAKYPRESMVDIMIVQYNVMRIEDSTTDQGPEMIEEEEETNIGTASGFNDDDSFVMWEKIKGTELPFQAEVIMEELRQGFPQSVHLTAGVKINLIILTVREVGRQVFDHCAARSMQPGPEAGVETEGDGSDMEKLELDIELIRKMQCMSVTNEFFQINHYQAQGPTDAIPSTLQLYKMAKVGLDLQDEFCIENILKQFEDACPQVTMINLLDIAALHLLTVRLVAWKIYLASAELAMRKPPTKGSIRLDLEWIKKYTNHGMF